MVLERRCDTRAPADSVNRLQEPDPSTPANRKKIKRNVLMPSMMAIPRRLSNDKVKDVPTADMKAILRVCVLPNIAKLMANQ